MKKIILIILILFCICGCTNPHENQERVCVEYKTRIVTRKRLISITTEYETYEEEYCSKYEWRDKE